MLPKYVFAPNCENRRSGNMNLNGSDHGRKSSNI